MPAVAGHNARVRVLSLEAGAAVNFRACRWSLSARAEEVEVSTPTGYGDSLDGVGFVHEGAPFGIFTSAYLRAEFAFDGYWDTDQDVFNNDPGLAVGRAYAVTVYAVRDTPLFSFTTWLLLGLDFSAEVRAPVRYSLTGPVSGPIVLGG